MQTEVSNEQRAQAWLEEQPKVEALVSAFNEAILKTLLDGDETKEIPVSTVINAITSFAANYLAQAPTKEERRSVISRMATAMDMIAQNILTQDGAAQ